MMGQGEETTGQSHDLERGRTTGHSHDGARRM